MARERSYEPPGQGIEPMTSELEGEEDGVPYGLLMWGQAGVYNAVDDRMLIAALSDSAVGVVRPTRLTAGPGLQVSVRAGWLAIASASDGTSAVVGSRQTHTVTETPGGSAARIDHVWIDTEPDNGRWRMRLVPQGTTVGRAGVSIGRITVPAGANLASQMTFSSLVPTLGRHADAHEITNSGTSLMRLTPHYPIAPYQIRPNRTFRVTAWGDGYMGAQVSPLVFRSAATASPIVRIDPRTDNPAAHQGLWWLGPRDPFGWYCETQHQVTPGGDRIRSSVRVTVTRWSSTNQQGGTTSPDRSVTATRSAWGGPYAPNWSEIQVQGAFHMLSSGQVLACHGSTFDTFEPYDA